MKRVRCPSNCGSPIKQLFVPKVRSDGYIELADGGTMNLQDEIQNMSEYCDIELLMQRYANGDTSALALRQDLYGDVAAFPSDYRSYIDNLRAANEFYNSLPNKDDFSDFSDFLAKVNDTEFLRNLKDINSLVDDVPLDNVPLEKEINNNET